MANIQEMIQSQILKAAEEQLDAEISKLETLTEDDLENIRKKRIEEMKQKQVKQQEWRANVWFIHSILFILWKPISCADSVDVIFQLIL